MRSGFRPGICLATVVLPALLACSDSTSPSEGFTVSGTIQNNTQTPIPENARLVVVWVVSYGSPDYSYVFGEGTIDPAGGSFEISMSDPPPAAALNNGLLGVGVLFVTVNAGLSTGDDIEDYPEADFIGAAGEYGIIYVRGNPSDAVQVREWAEDFESGYGVGVGMEVPGDFDKFVPTRRSGVVLTIDDIDNISFVNWT
jgi:hypothetical protein